MSFVLTCPHCGPREVTDFAYGGELRDVAPAGARRREVFAHAYLRRNVAGVQTEWWFHRSGCRAWFLAERDTRDNTVRWTRAVDRVGAA